MAEGTAESWQEKGDALFRDKKYEEALDCYLNATEINPELAPAWHNMGLICLMLGQQDEADICFQKEWEILQKVSRGQSQGGATRERKDGPGDIGTLITPEMAGQREEVPEITPVIPKIEGDVPQASSSPMKDEEKVIDIKPQKQKVQEVVPGIPQQQEGIQEELPGISPELRKVLEEFSITGPSQQQVREGIPPDNTKSQEVREQPPALPPDMPSLDNPDELYKEALQLSRNNQLEQALLVFDHVLQLDSTNYKAWNSRGIAFARLRQYQEAKSSFSRSLAINPAYQEAANNLDRVNGLLGAPSQKDRVETGQAILLPGSIDKEIGIPGPNTSCPHCGTEVPDDETGTCPSCGRIIRERAKNQELKSPVLAAVMSFLIPGLGQVYTGNTLRGILLLIGAFVGFIMLLVPGLIVLAYAVYDAYKTAKKINSGQVPYKKVNILVMIAFVIAAILMSIVLFALISAFIFGMQVA